MHQRLVLHDIRARNHSRKRARPGIQEAFGWWIYLSTICELRRNLGLDSN